MDVKIVTIPEKSVASVRHIGPYAECGKAWAALCAWAGPKGLIAGPGEFLGICYDDPEVTPPDRIRYDASLVVSDGIEPDGDVFIQTVGGGEYAQTLVQGPYSGLAAAYASHLRTLGTGKQPGNRPQTQHRGLSERPGHNRCCR